MTFKQMLKIAENNNIQAYRLVVATEVESYIESSDIQISEDTFETMCEFVYDWVINTSATPYEVINNLVKAITRDDQFEFTSESISNNWRELTEVINQMF